MEDIPTTDAAFPNSTLKKFPIAVATTEAFQVKINRAPVPYKNENTLWLYLLRFQTVLETTQKSFQMRQMSQRNNQIDRWFQIVTVSA